MTLRELLESGINIEGYKKIQCWENEDNPTIYYEGNGRNIPKEFKDREIAYIFPYNTGSEAAICIELAETETDKTRIL